MEEPFTLIDSPSSQYDRIFTRYDQLTSAKRPDLDVQLQTWFRSIYQKHHITAVPQSNCNFISYADAGHANAVIDREKAPVISFRGYLGSSRRGEDGSLGEGIRFARYYYIWKDEEFLLYVCQVGMMMINYIIKEAAHGESATGHCNATDALIEAVGRWQEPDDKFVWVFDNNYWQPNPKLYEQVMKASWDNVILNEGMKKELTRIVGTFFDNKNVYEDLGITWKRGILWYGPPGNGKTISAKALMKTLYSREIPIPCLYVKQAQYVFNLTTIFEKARAMSPCLLIFEDIDTIVTPMTRAYFFNEVDGLENNDGLMMLGSTNYLERLDPGLTKRPSRFDRKYLFPIPNFEERVLYCEFWRRKLEKNKKIDFPGFLCREMARITENFSFAYLQEAFVATMLVLTGNEGNDSVESREHQSSPEDFPIWREFSRQVSTLKRDMDSEGRVHFDEFAGGMADEPGLQADVREDVLVAREARESGAARGVAVLPPYLPEASYQAPEFSFDAMPTGIVVTMTRDGGKE